MIRTVYQNAIRCLQQSDPPCPVARNGKCPLRFKCVMGTLTPQFKGFWGLLSTCCRQWAQLNTPGPAWQQQIPSAGGAQHPIITSTAPKAPARHGTARSSSSRGPCCSSSGRWRSTHALARVTRHSQMVSAACVRMAGWQQQQQQLLAGVEGGSHDFLAQLRRFIQTLIAACRTHGQCPTRQQLAVALPDGFSAATPGVKHCMSWAAVTFAEWEQRPATVLQQGPGPWQIVQQPEAYGPVLN